MTAISGGSKAGFTEWYTNSKVISAGSAVFSFTRFPYACESCRITGGIADGMADISVPQIILDQAGIGAPFRQFITAGVA